MGPVRPRLPGPAWPKPSGPLLLVLSGELTWAPPCRARGAPGPVLTRPLCSERAPQHALSQPLLLLPGWLAGPRFAFFQAAKRRRVRRVLVGGSGNGCSGYIVLLRLPGALFDARCLRPRCPASFVNFPDAERAPLFGLCLYVSLRFKCLFRLPSDFPSFVRAL